MAYLGPPWRPVLFGIISAIGFFVPGLKYYRQKTRCCGSDVFFVQMKPSLRVFNRMGLSWERLNPQMRRAFAFFANVDTKRGRRGRRGRLLTQTNGRSQTGDITCLT
jgi:hypothetical protein